MSEYRKWLRFSIREVLWLTLVAALAVGWYAREREFRAAFDERLALIKEVLSTRYQLAQERISGLQDEKAQLEEDILKLKTEQSKAGDLLEHLLQANKTLEVENKTIAPDAADGKESNASHLAAIQRLTDENKSLKSQLKQKQAEYEFLQATIAAQRSAEVEVPDEKSSKRHSRKSNE